MSRLELSEQAHKILERETSVLDQEAAELSGKPHTPPSVLSAVCKLLNGRGRYFAITGEHFSVQDYDGLMLVDRLDEHLIRHIGKLLRSYLEHESAVDYCSATDIVAGKLLPSVSCMPRYPVAYRLLYTIRQSFEQFSAAVDSSTTQDIKKLERSFITHLDAIVSKFMETRERVGMRHFSDVAREYDFVARMKCRCGTGPFKVRLQSLVQEDAVPYDRLELECSACGHQRSITFDLPHFKDLYQA